MSNTFNKGDILIEVRGDGLIFWYCHKKTPRLIQLSMLHHTYSLDSDHRPSSSTLYQEVGPWWSDLDEVIADSFLDYKSYVRLRRSDIRLFNQTTGFLTLLEPETPNQPPFNMYPSEDFEPILTLRDTVERLRTLKKQSALPSLNPPTNHL